MPVLTEGLLFAWAYNSRSGYLCSAVFGYSYSSRTVDVSGGLTHHHSRRARTAYQCHPVLQEPGDEEKIKAANDEETTRPHAKRHGRAQNSKGTGRDKHAGAEKHSRLDRWPSVTKVVLAIRPVHPVGGTFLSRRLRLVCLYTGYF